MEGWTLETNCFDFMHNAYLGVCRDLIGSGLRLFIRQGFYTSDGDLDTTLAAIQEEMVKDCADHGPLTSKVDEVFFCGWVTVPK